MSRILSAVASQSKLAFFSYHLYLLASQVDQAVLPGAGFFLGESMTALDVLSGRGRLARTSHDLY